MAYFLDTNLNLAKITTDFNSLAMDCDAKTFSCLMNYQGLVMGTSVYDIETVCELDNTRLVHMTKATNPNGANITGKDKILSFNLPKIDGVLGQFDWRNTRTEVQISRNFLRLLVIRAIKYE